MEKLIYTINSIEDVDKFNTYIKENNIDVPTLTKDGIGKQLKEYEQFAFDIKTGIIVSAIKDGKLVILDDLKIQ